MIAVTGASGLLGRHLVDNLVAGGHSVKVIVRREDVRFPAGASVHVADVLDPIGLSQALKGATAVIHAAGLVSFNPRRRDEIFAVNVEGTRNVVNGCLEVSVPVLVHISSVSALGRKPGEPVTESDPWTGMFQNDYSRSKYLAELEAFRGGEEGLNVSVVNPSVILSGDPVHRSSGSLFDYVWRERPFYTSGTLNYVDVRDVADAVDKLIRAPRPGERFILSGGSVPYKSFFENVASHWKKRTPSVRIPSVVVRAVGLAEEMRGWFTGREPLVTRHSAAMTVRNFKYDTAKARKELGLVFRELDDTLAWCCDRYAQEITGNK